MNIDEKVDALFDPPVRPKRRRFGIRRRTAFGIFTVLGIALMLTAAATILPYFGRMEVTVEVEQAITIDGNDWNVPITFDLGQVNTGCLEEKCTDEHIISNDGCDPICLDWSTWGDPDMEGITPHFMVKEEILDPCCDHILAALGISVLDGMAQWDDFEVYIGTQLVYSYDAKGGNPENWIMHAIDLTTFEIQCCGKHTIEVKCTAPQPWTNFNPYGQLGVDTIELYCEPDIIGGPMILCDSVDIGNPASEEGHNMLGWGPIEPLTNGGTWGGIDDCRAAWKWTTGDTLADTWMTTDYKGAHVDLTCAECYEPDIRWVEWQTPFCIDPEEDIIFKFCYEFDPMIGGGLYTIYHDLILGDCLGDCELE